MSDFGRSAPQGGSDRPLADDGSIHDRDGSDVARLHAAVKHGQLPAIKALLDKERRLANARSETDMRGTYPNATLDEWKRAAEIIRSYGGLA